MSPIRRLAMTLGYWLLAPAVAAAADGSVHLYLQPFPPEAARLTFVVASVSALGANGREQPLDLNLKTVSQREAGRQRLLASGRLPSGSYSGFVFTIKQAALKGERGDAALAVPDAPARLSFPFSVAGQQAPLLWLTLKYQESVTDGAGFSPVFSAVVPSMPIVGHAGFVTNTGSNTITVVDTHLGQAVAVIDTCAGPSGMALDRFRRRLYVACAKDDEIRSIDVATGETIERTRVSPGDRPREVALTPDGLTLLSANTGSGSVSFFDAPSLSRGERINAGNGPNSVLIDPTGRRAFVFNTLASSVSVIDVANHSLVATVSTDASPLRGQFGGRGDRLYVIHERSPYMTVIDPQHLTLVTRARLKTSVEAIEVDRVRDLVCVGGNQDTVVDFYDPKALMPLYGLKTRSGVSHLRIDVENNALYMVSPDTRSVVVGRLSDRKVASEIDVGDRPYEVAVMGER